MRQYIVLLFFLFINIVVEAQDTKSLVSEIHVCLQNNHTEQARIAYQLLKKSIGSYVGAYSGAFDLYMSVCIEQLNITIDQDEVARFYEMCVNGNDITNQAKGKVLSEIASTLCDYGHSSLGLSYYQELLKLEEEIEPIYFYRYLMDVGWAYNSCQMPQKAFLSFKRCANYFERLYGNRSRNYAKALNAMVYVARFINVDYFDLLTKEHGIYVANGDTISKQYAVCLDNYSGYFNKKNDLEKALSYVLKANRIFERVDSGGADLALSYNNIGAVYKRLSERDPSFLPLAEHFLIKSMEISPTESAALNLALFYDYQVGLPDKASEYYDYLSEFDRHNVYAMEVGNHYALIGDYETFSLYMSEYIDYIRLAQQQNVPFMSTRERGNYIKMVQSERMENLFKFAAEARHESLSGLCFNYLLMSKSLMLSYDANIDEIVRQTNNKELRELYFTLGILRHNLQRNNNLKEKVDSLEHLFLDKLSHEGNFSEFTSLEFHNVQKCLSSNDGVIEFYESRQSNSPHLYAVILTARNKPVVVDCCSVEEERKYMHKHILSDRIWNSIASSLEGVSRIYFVPDGNLYNYPFESELSLINPKIKLYRLSSSRELVRKHSCISCGAAIYGGLNYSMDIDKMIADACLYRGDVILKVSDEAVFPQSLRYSIEGLPPLPSTLIEAKSIASIISSTSNTKDTVKVYTGENGTENSLKFLSGKQKRILHIATHGFYNDNNDSRHNYKDRDDALLRSGLFLAGADNKFTDNFVPDSIEDGVLTAQEISELDFHGMELVGLSACQTAQGDVTSDGVFGLQRGFKKAGAQSILMSLWKVNDEATCLLMTEFYKNWIGNGRTKHDALEQAKQTVRSHKEKGWDDPKYWAAFILLDGLD